MSERRRAEINEKRQRLAQLKQAREEREHQARAAAAASLSASGLPPPASPGSSSTDTGLARGSRGSAASRTDEIDSLLRTVGVARDRTSALLARDSASQLGSSTASKAASSTAGEGDDEVGEREAPGSPAAPPPPPPAPAVEHLDTDPSCAAPTSTDSCVPSPSQIVAPLLQETDSPPLPQPDRRRRRADPLVVVHRGLLAPAQAQGRLRQGHPDLVRPPPSRLDLDLDLDLDLERVLDGRHERDGRRPPRAHHGRARSRARRARRRHRLGARPRRARARGRARGRPRAPAARERPLVAGVRRVCRALEQGRAEGVERLVRLPAGLCDWRGGRGGRRRGRGGREEVEVQVGREVEGRDVGEGEERHGPRLEPQGASLSLASAPAPSCPASGGRDARSPSSRLAQAH